MKIKLHKLKESIDKVFDNSKMIEDIKLINSEEEIEEFKSELMKEIILNQKVEVKVC